ncbi:MAG: hypothetical protein HN406_15085 [Lentisphaerae bacterium]|jgi:hypothetical protein|nr:hypothetical protein [Lentisphaerota bacterium]
MDRDDSRTPTLLSSSGELTLQFLSLQIGTLTSHLQIADAKTAGVIAYITVLSGYTVTKVGAPVALLPSAAGWFALAGAFTAFLGLAAAFMTVLPRGWRGRRPYDPFSWVGLATTAHHTPYSDRITKLTQTEMVDALADAVESTSLIVAAKYKCVSASIYLAIASSILQIASWLVA